MIHGYRVDGSTQATLVRLGYSAAHHANCHVPAGGRRGRRRPALGRGGRRGDSAFAGEHHAPGYPEIHPCRSARRTRRCSRSTSRARTACTSPPPCARRRATARTPRSSSSTARRADAGWSSSSAGRAAIMAGPVWERFLQEGFVVVVADYRGGSMAFMSTPRPNGLITSIDDGLAIIDYVRRGRRRSGSRSTLWGQPRRQSGDEPGVARAEVKSAILGAPATIWFLGMTVPPRRHRAGSLQGREARSRDREEEHRADQDAGADPGRHRRQPAAGRDVPPRRARRAEQIGAHGSLRGRLSRLRAGPAGPQAPDLPQGEALFDSGLDALEKSVRFVKSEGKSTDAR